MQADRHGAAGRAWEGGNACALVDQGAQDIDAAGAEKLVVKGRVGGEDR